MGIQIYSTGGTYSWTAPVGVTSVTVTAIGGGGGGGTTGIQRGGGGGGCAVGTLTVVPGTAYAVNVGAGGAALGAGGNSSISGFGLTADGGAAGGTVGGGVGAGGGATGGTSNYTGGNGDSTSGAGGGGGGAAGPTANGVNASSSTGGASGGAPGGAGGNASASGSASGGGGGTSGAGADGYISIVWVDPTFNVSATTILNLHPASSQTRNVSVAATGTFALHVAARIPNVYTVTASSTFNLTVSASEIDLAIILVSASSTLALHTSSTGSVFQNRVVTASDSILFQSSAPFRNWVDMRANQSGYGYINPIRRSTSDKFKLHAFATEIKNSTWTVSAANSVNLAGLASEIALRSYAVTATGRVNLSGLAVGLGIHSYTVSAATSVNLSAVASELATRLWSVAASTAVRLSGAAVNTGTHVYLVAAVTSVALHGALVPNSARGVAATTHINLSVVATAGRDRTATAGTTVTLHISAGQARDVHIASTTSMGLHPADRSNQFSSVTGGTVHVNLSGVATVALSHLTATGNVQLTGVASAYSVLASGSVVNGGDSGVGPQNLLMSGISQDFPFTYAEMPNGSILIANGIDPMIRWDGMVKLATFAGIQPPQSSIALAGQGVGTITGMRYAFVRFLDQYGNPSNLSPISNVVNMGRDALIDNLSWDTTTGIVKIVTKDHGLLPGEQLVFQGIHGIGASTVNSPLVNGTWTPWSVLKVIDQDTFTLSGVRVYSGQWTEGGWWTWGISQIVYQAVPIPTDPKAVRRQILRNLEGSADTFYVDLDTRDLITTTFYSSTTDDQLAVQQAVSLESEDGLPLANLYAPPPSHKAVIISHLGRIFAAVDRPYSLGCVRPIAGSKAIQGIGTNWPGTWAGRMLYVTGAPTPCEIQAIDPQGQTIVLVYPYPGQTQPYATYTIRPAIAERKLVYYCEPTSAECWPPWNAFAVPEDGDQLTGLMVHSSFLFVLEQRHIYRYTFQRDPGPAPDGDSFIFLAVERGAVNHRCVVRVEDKAYMLDEAGVHVFDGGQSSEPISEPVQNFFYSDGLQPALQIDWSADRTLWHAAHEPVRATIRWFVQMVGYDGIYHALCYDYRHERWWIEQYPTQITASVESHLGFRRSLVGTEARKVLCLGQGTMDAVDPSAGTINGTVTSADSVSITDSTANFAANLNGVPVAIVAGTGRDQQNIVTTNTTTKLNVLNNWAVVPDATSRYQVGGVNWSWRSGWFEFDTDLGDETENPKDVEVVYRPLQSGTLADLQLYYDHADTAYPWSLTYSGDGMSTINGDPHIQINLQSRSYASGYAIQRMSDHGQSYAFTERFVSVQLSGTQAAEAIQIYQVSIKGVVANEDDRKEDR